MAELSTTDKERVRYHLDYQNIIPNSPLFASLVLGTYDQYLLEYVMNSLLPEAVPRVQSILAELDSIEAQMIDSRTRLQASKADVVTMNPDEFQMLQYDYDRWRVKLCNQLGVNMNTRPAAGNQHPLNFRVSN